MAVKISRDIMIKANGQEYRFDEKAETAVSTSVTVTCDGPRCVGKDNNPVSYTWTQEAAQQNHEAIPDGAWRLITLEPFSGEKKVFCSRYCLRDYMRTYEPPRSPREMTAEMQANMKAAQEKAQEGAVNAEYPISGETFTQVGCVGGQCHHDHNVVQMPAPEQ